MSYVIKDLLKKDTTTVVYPNILGDNIPSGAVTTAKIADSAVTTTKIDDSAVTTAKLDDASVTTNKIATGAVTESRLSSGAVTIGKMGFHLYHHAYQLYTASPATATYIEFDSVSSGAYSVADIFQLLFDRYGTAIPCCYSTRSTLDNPYGYSLDNSNIEFNEGGETYSITTLDTTISNSKITSIF